MVGAPVETYCEDKTWRNRLEGGDPLPGEYQTQEAAVDAARGEARVRGVEHVIRRADGSLADVRRYPRTSWELPM
jgi:hypothetical protein